MLKKEYTTTLCTNKSKACSEFCFSEMITEHPTIRAAWRQQHVAHRKLQLG